MTKTKRTKKKTVARVKRTTRKATGKARKPTKSTQARAKGKNTHPRYVTRSEFARLVGVSPAEITYSVQRGRIVTTTRNGKTVIDTKTQIPAFEDTRQHTGDEKASGPGRPESPIWAAVRKHRAVRRKIENEELLQSIKDKTASLAPRETVFAIWADIESKTRAAIDSIPDRIVGALKITDSGKAEKVREIARIETRYILEDLDDQAREMKAKYGARQGDEVSSYTALAKALANSPPADNAEQSSEMALENELQERYRMIDAIVERERRAGRLVSSVEADRELSVSGERNKKAVMSIADRISPLVAPETDRPHCWGIIENVCRALLGELADAIENPEPAPRRKRRKVAKS